MAWKLGLVTMERPSSSCLWLLSSPELLATSASFTNAWSRTPRPSSSLRSSQSASAAARQGESAGVSSKPSSRAVTRDLSDLCRSCNEQSSRSTGALGSRPASTSMSASSFFCRRVDRQELNRLKADTASSGLEQSPTFTSAWKLDWRASSLTCCDSVLLSGNFAAGASAVAASSTPGWQTAPSNSAASIPGSRLHKAGSACTTSSHVGPFKRIRRTVSTCLR
mmetsp:Transcript_74299/g.205062  ORF Transcript_74299/g.205062 Transcript_74299/m.205062 type:complete len:223 (+) Transcript_74299:362-1030(+)